jgi:hypothetical protein
LFEGCICALNGVNCQFNGAKKYYTENEFLLIENLVWMEIIASYNILEKEGVTQRKKSQAIFPLRPLFSSKSAY